MLLVVCSLIDVVFDLISDFCNPLAHFVACKYKWHLFSIVEQITRHLQSRDTILLRVNHGGIDSGLPYYLSIGNIFILLLQVIK